MTDDAFVTAPDMLARLIAGSRAMAAHQRGANGVCDHQWDHASASVSEDFINGPERRI